MGEKECFNISDLAGLSEPLTKLIETVSSAIGKVYEPWHVKRMAKAKAKELELISGTINDNLQLPMKYENESVVIDSTNANELVQRAQNRFLFQEMKKQQNIESVIGVAYSELENVSSISDTPVDSDWVSEFFNNVANISNEQMQLLWGKLLAGEIKCPGSFSLRTLSVLRNLTQNEARLFQEIVPYVLNCPADNEDTCRDYFLLESFEYGEQGLLHKYNIPFTKIMLLSDAGVLTSNSQISVAFDVIANTAVFIKGINKAIRVANESQEGYVLQVRHPAYLLTEAGKDLFSISLTGENCKNSDEYISECLQEIKNGGVFFPLGEILPDELTFEVVDMHNCE